MPIESNSIYQTEQVQTDQQQVKQPDYDNVPLASRARPTRFGKPGRQVCID